jgi:hypothetical protein
MRRPRWGGHTLIGMVMMAIAQPTTHLQQAHVPLNDQHGSCWHSHILPCSVTIMKNLIFLHKIPSWASAVLPPLCIRKVWNMYPFLPASGVSSSPQGLPALSSYYLSNSSSQVLCELYEMNNWFFFNKGAQSYIHTVEKHKSLWFLPWLNVWIWVKISISKSESVRNCRNADVMISCDGEEFL